MTRRTASLILTTVLLAGCPAAEKPHHTPAHEDTAPNMTEPLTLNTADGQITLTSMPKKIAVYDYALLDTLTALGIKPAAVPEQRFLPYLEKATAGIPAAGTLFEPDLETLNQIRPDWIILGLATARPKNELEKIAPTANLAIPGTTLISSGLQRLEELGKLFKTPQKAAQLKKQVSGELQKVQNTIKQQNPGAGLVIMIDGGKLSAFGQNSYFGWIYREIGLKPIRNLPEDAHPMPVSFEYLHQQKPQWLVVVDRTSATGQTGARAAEITANNLISQTPAAQSRRIVHLSNAAFIAGGGINQIRQDLAAINQAFRK